MKVSFNWLKDYVAIRVSPKVLAEKLTMAGLEVGSIEQQGSDTVFEIEVTANRPDCLSVRGIAQEVAAVLDTKLKHMQPTRTTKMRKDKDLRLPANFIRIKDKKGCAFYRGCLIGNVTVSASPAWLKNRIEALGIRSINNIVDITNYCLLEFGQPLHAFDYDKLAGGIIVRRAHRKEKILTIDGVERELGEDIVLISDTKRGIAIAGVMGDKLSEVGALTKNILLESAYFDPVLIRRASRALGMSTESSYRFERGVDFDGVIQAQDKAVALICEVAGAQLLDIQTDGRRPASTKHRISFHCQRANEMLSLQLRPAAMKHIFESLGFRAKQSAQHTLLVDVPSARRDIMLEEDLIEECARIHGYHNIPTTMPAIRSCPITNSVTERMKQPVREILCALGFDEIITYSLVGKDMAAAGDVSDAVRLLNPLSSEQEYLRPALTSTMLQCVSYNFNRANKNLRFFEISHVFDAEHHETMSLALLATGSRIDDWRTKQEMDFFVLKGAIEALLHRLGVDGVVFAPLDEHSAFSRNESSRITCQNRTIGTLGRIDNAMLLRFDIKHAPPVLYAELSLTQLCACSRSAPTFVPLAIYPAAIRDMSLIAKDGIRYEEITNTIQAATGSVLKQITLCDRYRGEQVPAGCVSLTVSLVFSREDRTLTDAEVDALVKKITQALKADLAVAVRS